MQDRNDQEYEQFMLAGTQLGLAPVSIAPTRSPAYQRIRKDLVASRWKLAALYIALTCGGYGVSLSLCAQNGVGILPLSYRVAGSMHFIPWPWCPLVCGALFTAVPNIFSRVFFTRFQQRYLMKRLGWLVAAAPFLASVSLVLMGERNPSAFFEGLMVADFAASEWLVLWGIGALVSVALLELGAAFVIFRRHVPTA